jgi:hypothetical protein
MAEETKNQKFVRLANARTIKALKDLKLLVNLGSNQYASTQGQRNHIIIALREALEEVEYSWSGNKVDKAKFSLEGIK